MKSLACWKHFLVYYLKFTSAGAECCSGWYSSLQRICITVSISLQPYLRSNADISQAALSNYWELCLLEWRSNKMLVNFMKCGFGLLCSLWKCILHAPAFAWWCLGPLMDVVQRPHWFILCCLPSFCDGVPVSFTATFRCDRVSLLTFLALVNEGMEIPSWGEQAGLLQKWGLVGKEVHIG